MSKPRATPPRLDATAPARRLALAQLLDAYDVARETGHDPWTYACQLESLLGQKVSDTALRWLVDQELAAHRRETTKPAARRRTFKRSPNGHFTAASCFCLTEAGVIMARQHNQETTTDGAVSRTSSPLHLFTSSSLAPHPSPLTPHYDAARRTLFFGPHVAKQFKVPAGNQKLILTAFEEENWPEHIDDPLPPLHEIDPKKRLSDAVFRLNQRQKNRLILFECNGTGCGVKWREIDGRSTGDRREIDGRATGAEENGLGKLLPSHEPIFFRTKKV